MIKKIKVKYIPFIVFVVALMVSMALFNINSKNLYLITFGIMLVTSLYLFIREFKVLWGYFKFYMFNLEKKADFDKRVQRPRLFFYLTFGLLNIFSFYQLLNIDKIGFSEGG